MPVANDTIKTQLPEALLRGAGIIRTLAYFDIFQYPLSRKEIQQFHEEPLATVELDQQLNDLVANKVIFTHKQFYSLHDNPLLACKRIPGNGRARQLLPKAMRIGRFLYRFPFVKGIAVSGSLSKNFADEKADIDFFIITKANRLWIARTLMHLFKKLAFLTGRQHYYCMNYYIDEETLALDDRNIFTAMEIKTLLPVSGEKAFDSFFAANGWSNDWLPACAFRRSPYRDPSTGLFKRIGECCCNGTFGDRIDTWLMQLTTRRWKRKQERGQRNQKGYTVGLATGKHFARSNPGSFQEKVLAMYEKRLKEFRVNKK